MKYVFAVIACIIYYFVIFGVGGVILKRNLGQSSIAQLVFLIGAIGLFSVIIKKKSNK